MHPKFSGDPSTAYVVEPEVKLKSFLINHR